MDDTDVLRFPAIIDQVKLKMFGNGLLIRYIPGPVITGLIALQHFKGKGGCRITIESDGEKVGLEEEATLVGQLIT
jgi:hypothetical protein